ncbi:MAG: phage tail protein [Hungatella sp.]|nr:phage tail protein [Hungatella sp.]
MARIGSFGDLVFSVSDKTVRTFDSMSWDFSADYATHDRHIKADLLEYIGPSIETISFSMVFSVFLGVNPLKEIRRLRNMVQSGYAQRLVIGGKVYGSYKWVMQKGTVDLKRFDRQGELWAASAKVTLKEYPKR